MKKNNRFNNISFSDEMMKEFDNAEKCFEHLAWSTFMNLSPHFNKWFTVDTYITGSGHFLVLPLFLPILYQNEHVLSKGIQKKIKKHKIEIVNFLIYILNQYKKALKKNKNIDEILKLLDEFGLDNFKDLKELYDEEIDEKWLIKRLAELQEDK